MLGEKSSMGDLYQLTSFCSHSLADSVSNITRCEIAKDLFLLKKSSEFYKMSEHLFKSSESIHCHHKCMKSLIRH